MNYFESAIRFSILLVFFNASLYDCSGPAGKGTVGKPTAKDKNIITAGKGYILCSGLSKAARGGNCVSSKIFTKKPTVVYNCKIDDCVVNNQKVKKGRIVALIQNL
ncbi:hypothetical protein BY996DRAFT_6423968 [Phakopsora pachyrhizi]|nr:hypothetical protein BY996DRAFT_6423968 [Phakopsora pachyrhizi]